MIDVEEIEKILPYYLTGQERESLLKEIKGFPENVDQRFFTSYLKNEKNIFQGDGYSDFLFINLPNPKIAKMPAMVISNTCDIDQNNKRLAPKRIVYAPIYQLEKYKQLLMKDHAQSGAENPESIQRGGVIHHHNVKKTWSAPPPFFFDAQKGVLRVGNDSILALFACIMIWCKQIKYTMEVKLCHQ